MSFERKEDGSVQLTFSQREFESLQMSLGNALGETMRVNGERFYILLVINRIQTGDLHFVPYEVGKCVQCGELLTDPETHNCPAKKAGAPSIQLASSTQTSLQSE